MPFSHVFLRMKKIEFIQNIRKMFRQSYFCPCSVNLRLNECFYMRLRMRFTEWVTGWVSDLTLRVMKRRLKTLKRFKCVLKWRARHDGTSEYFVDFDRRQMRTNLNLITQRTIERYSLKLFWRVKASNKWGLKSWSKSRVINEGNT